MKLKTPDLTPAQLVSSFLAVLGLLVSQGIVDNTREKLIGGLASIVIPVFWQLADAVIRHGRSKAVAATHYALAAGIDPSTLLSTGRVGSASLEGTRVVVKEDTMAAKPAG